MADAKRGKTSVSKSRLVFVLFLTGLKRGARFLNQSSNVLDAKPITFRPTNENRPVRVVRKPLLLVFLSE